MSNRRFPTDKNREISLLKAGFGSIRRRLGRRNNLGQGKFSTTFQANSATMPKNKGRRGEAAGDREAGETDESYVNGSEANGSSNQAGDDRGGENDNGVDNDRTNNNLSSGRRRQTGGSSSSQHKSKHGLGPWTEAVSEAIQYMGATHRAIRDLQDKFDSHLEDLRTMEENKEILRQLEDECRRKDEEVQKHETTISTLTSMNQKAEKMITQERQDLEQQKAKLDKRHNTIMAEERLKLENELEKLVKVRGQSYDKRKKELEDEFTAKREENNSRVATLETENRQLSKTVEKQNATIEDRTNKLEKSMEQCDVLERAQKLTKAELLDREKELEMLKREFALNTKSKAHFKQRFAEIYRIIEDISLKYFSSIDRKDLEKIRKDLEAVDRCFASVPLDESDDSRNLCIAHAQRIISDVICEYIWKPFRSEFTMSHPGFDNLLAKISDKLEKSSHSGRTADVWTALTTRGLQLLPADVVIAPAPDIKESLRPVSSSRVEGVISKVFSVLYPLISPSQVDDLRIDLLNLTNLSINIWNDAQTGELKVMINTSLELAHREEWRSYKFDPAPPPDSYDEIGLDIISKTHPRIFTLFPRVMAWEAVGPIKPDAGPPGSWISDSEQGARRIETCIHPGVGLPEWSQLVVRGKEEQEQTNEYLTKAVENAVENAMKELHKNRRLTGHGRRESTASLMSPPSSPSQQWKNGGATISQKSDL